MIKCALLPVSLIYMDQLLLFNPESDVYNTLINYNELLQVID